MISNHISVAIVFGIDVDGNVNEWNDKTVSLQLLIQYFAAESLLITSLLYILSCDIHRPRSLDSQRRMLLTNH